jgi:hypothetical protein
VAEAAEHTARPREDVPARVRRQSAPVVQAKMRVGAVSDPLERQADRIANEVTAIVRRMSRREPVHAPEADESTTRIRRAVRPVVARAPIGHRCGPGCVQRHPGHHGHEHEHSPEVGTAGGELGSELTTRIRRSSGRGAQLDDAVRAPMESAFGSDFSAVRVHADSDLAPRLGASAFTTGADIHFAPGAYRPTDRSGQWLLAHELTHVVQQTGAGIALDPGVHRHFGSCIQRHASKEHYMLGSMTPAQLKAIADAKGKVDAAVAASSGFMNLFNSLKMPPKKELDEGLQSVQEQLIGLDNWRSAAVDNPDPAAVPKGETTYDHYWGGQLMTVPCLDGEIVCTVGEINAIPDFFGSFDDLARVSRSIVFKTLQVIRRESYMYLKGLEAQLQGKKYSYDAKAEGFAGLEGNKISIAGVGPKASDDLGDLWATESMLKGTGTEVGLDDATGASATLGRNACHFPPESWLRWRDHHNQARNLIAGATTVAGLGALANRAIGLNAFGEHYLQDSFASGHLINKGFVMAIALEHRVTGGLDDNQIAEIQAATAHTDAYALPADAKAKVDAKAAGNAVPNNSIDDPTMKPRDPQSALESAKAVGAQGGTRAEGRREEMSASGINPDSMTFAQYRGFLNDLWLQKITNTLHDKYCVNGLSVASPDNPTIFKIYGDSNMMRSSEGATYTAATSQMSRNAINALVNNKREELSAAEAGGPARQPLPVASVEDIIARFPNRVVDDDGTEMPLVQWATGAPMRKKVGDIVNALTGDFVTGFLRGVSAFKPVSAGLDASHGPF